jgi:hypothetical protein
MQGNPFYVDPFGGYGKEIVRGLSGLGAVLGERQQIKQAQEEEAMLMQEAQDVFASNDPNRIAEFSLKAPKFAQRVSQAVGFKNDATRQNMIDSTQRILMGEDPEQVIIERAQMVQAQGGDPINTLQELDVYRQDPQAFMRNAERAYALLNPQGYAAFRQATAPMEGEKLTGNMANTALAMFGTADVSRLTPEQRQAVQMEAQRTGGTQNVPAKIVEWQQYQELKRTDPAGAVAFGQAAGFVDKDGKLSAFAEKTLSQATNEAVEATNNQERFTALADELEASDFGGGLFGGSWREKLKDITGQQDAVTELRKKFNGIKASQVVNNLPPGAASDADIALALSGFPSDNYNAAQLASFMRGLAKLEGYRGQFAEFRANYISENKNESGLLKAWKAQTGGDGNAAPRSQTSAPSAAQIEQAARQLGITVEQFRKDMGL